MRIRVGRKTGIRLESAAKNEDALYCVCDVTLCGVYTKGLWEGTQYVVTVFAGKRVVGPSNLSSCHSLASQAVVRSGPMSGTHSIICPCALRLGFVSSVPNSNLYTQNYINLKTDN